MTTAPQRDIAPQTLRVTHPFHPWYGRSFELVARRTAWGEDRVYFHDENEQLFGIPATWTDVVAVDPWVQVAAGRALFRAADLVELLLLMRRVSGEGDGHV